MKHIFLDIETTGLKPVLHEIIEICIITEEEDGSLDIYEQKIQPVNLELASKKALEINGFNHDEWCHARSFSDCAHEIADRIKGKDKLIIGHNPKFDVDFIEEHLFRNALTLKRIRTFDTASLAYEHLEPLGLESLSLTAIRRFLGWKVEGSHRALKDAEDARRLFHLLRRAGIFLRFRIKMRVQLHRFLGFLRRVI